MTALLAEPTLPAGLASALGAAAAELRLDPNLAQDLVARLMAPLLHSPRLHNWHLSSLTAPGFPFELTFSSANDGLRCTMEIAAHDTAPAQRLGLAAAVLRRIDTAVPDARVLSALHRLQQDAALRFGCWGGLRLSADGTVRTKLYAEVPAQRQAQAEAWLTAQCGLTTALPLRPKVLRMIGYTPATGAIEPYYSILGLRPWELAALMQPVGLQARAPDVRATFEAVLSRPLHQTMPSPELGFSYALDGRTGTAFSLYAFCEHLFASDGAARARLLRLKDRSGFAMAGYAAASAPLLDDARPARCHGLFGVSVAQGGPPLCHIGLCPPDREIGHG